MRETSVVSWRCQGHEEPFKTLTLVFLSKNPRRAAEWALRWPPRTCDTTSRTEARR